MITNQHSQAHSFNETFPPECVHTPSIKNIYFSIVIPTFNRSHQLDQCLELIFRQNYPLDKYEVIVVDDNSDDGTAKILYKYSKNYQNFNIIRNQQRKGPYYSRNLGAKHAKGEIVIFTDDDCLVPSDWLSKICKVFQNPNVSCVQGTQLYRGKYPSLEPEGKFYLKSLQKRRSFDTKNLAIKRNLILECGFDKRFRTGGDRELGKRMYFNNIKINYNPTICVIHAANHSFKDQIRRAKNWGTSLAYIQKVYGWNGINPRFQYPFLVLSIFYLATFPYYLFKLRSLKGSIAFISMLLVQGLYFKRLLGKHGAGA